jgi:hypothetical protein
MSSPDEQMAEAIAAARSGRRQEARRLLTTILAHDPNNEKALLWLSGVVDTREAQIRCLRRALAINPDSQMARVGLARLGARPEEMTPISAPAASPPPAAETPAAAPPAGSAPEPEPPAGSRPKAWPPAESRPKARPAAELSPIYQKPPPPQTLKSRPVRRPEPEPAAAPEPEPDAEAPADFDYSNLETILAEPAGKADWRDGEEQPAEEGKRRQDRGYRILIIVAIIGLLLLLAAAIAANRLLNPAALLPGLLLLVAGRAGPAGRT